MHSLRWLKWTLAISLAGVAWGCKEKDSGGAEHSPREEPVFESPPPGSGRATATQPGHTESSGHDVAPALPPGHPPISGLAMQGDPRGEAMEIKLDPPADWQIQPARMATLAVYSAPPSEGDEAAADFAISTLGKKIELSHNIEFWCTTRMELPPGQTCEEAAKVSKLEGANLPVMLVEIAGAYKGAGMGRSGPAKPGYIMLIAEITPDDGIPYYARLTAPEKTLEKHRPAFIEMVRNAEQR
jgi:hypothetical protein